MSPLQASLDQGGVVVIPPGIVTLTESLYARSNVTVLAHGVTFVKDFYGSSFGAIFRNEDFAEKVNNFTVVGFPTLSTGPNGSGKLTFLVGDFIRIQARLGAWKDHAMDGFGVAVAGENMDLEVYGGEPGGTGGLAGVQVFGGSGRVKAVGVKSGDDCVGLFGIRPDVALVGGLSINDMYVEAINCESTSGRIVAMGVAASTPFNTGAAGMEVRNVVAKVVGGKACSESEFVQGTAAVMVFANPNLPRTNVRENTIEAFGVDCSGRAYPGRSFNTTDCVIRVYNPVRPAETGMLITDTTRFTGCLEGDLSTLPLNSNAVLCIGNNVRPRLTVDVVVPPRSTNGPAMTFPAAGTVSDAELDISLHGIAPGHSGLSLTAGALRTNILRLRELWA